MFSKPIDFIAIGDITTDAFIRMKEAHVTCSIDKTNCEICMKFGDKIPYESVDIIRAVGNSANAAVSASRLGLNSHLMANIGTDQNGKECLETLKAEKVGTKYVTVHKGMITNYHYVLWYNDERTIMVKHQEYPYSFPNIKAPKYLYLSSLGGNSYEYHIQIAKYLTEHPEVKLVFQPGTFQMKLGYEKLEPLYEKSEIFFCNVEEAQRILETEEKDLKKIMSLMRAKGPRVVVITDGPNGAYAFDGTKALFMPPYPDTKPPFERTGAGDAFASTFTCALILGKSIEEALRWAPINSMCVVQDIGAQRGLLTQKQLLEYLAKAPESYKAREI
jgi:ribokinase